MQGHNVTMGLKHTYFVLLYLFSIEIKDGALLACSTRQDTPQMETLPDQHHLREWKRY